MRNTFGLAVLSVFAVLLLPACQFPFGQQIIADVTITQSAIDGVTAPVVTETPVTQIIENEQYSGSVSWSPSDATFQLGTVYTATITLEPKAGYSIEGVSTNFFTVKDAVSVSNNANSTVITAKFPITTITTLTTLEIPGLTVPVIGELPDTTNIETVDYRGTVSWQGSFERVPTFGGGKAYSATIVLTPKAGYTLEGIIENSFTVPGAVSVTNAADSGEITVSFPATATLSIGNEALGGRVAYILEEGDPGYVAGEQRGFIVSGTSVYLPWGAGPMVSTYVSGLGSAIGTGAANTEVIVATHVANGVTDMGSYAAGVAASFNGGGYTDWYLPSVEELRLVWENRAAIGTFSSGVYYWTSTQNTATSVKALYINAGSSMNLEGNFSKSSQYNLRAMRSF